MSSKSKTDSESLSSGRSSRNEREREAAVLIHGLGSNRLFMTPLSVHLKRAGFRAHNYGYASFFRSLEQHANSFGDFLNRIDQDREIDRWHIVAHSLGSIITRQLLCETTFEKLGRVVMLAPPNLGSPAARRLSYLLPYSKTVKQISDQPESYVNHMPTPQGVEIGIVAASYDFVVSPESSQLESAKDYVTVYGGHNGLLVRPTAAKQAISFLKTGEFLVSKTQAAATGG